MRHYFISSLGKFLRYSGSMLLLILLSSILKISCLKCFQDPFPLIFGGNNGDSIYQAIDLDSNNNIVAGGYTYADDVHGYTSGTTRPLVTYYRAT